ncbi:MAG: ribonuclease Y [Candidatus Uhrbacteria bacterium]|nr:ribonuclease Y [Candidatus Uhrbacteria bacterium]
MNNALFVVIAVTAGTAIGLAIGYAIREFAHRRKLSGAQDKVAQAERKASDMMKDAEKREVEALAKAKDKAIKILEEARLEEKRALEDVKKQQQALLEREQTVSARLLDIDKSRGEVEQAKQKAEEAHRHVEDLKTQAIAKLEEVANLDQESALNRLLSEIEERHSETLMARLRKLDNLTAEEIDRKTKNILATAIQRQASSHVCETTTTYVELPTEEMKGRIIGREGRNIKAIELLTGCELIIDDTPNVVTISGFSPIRRQVTKRALEKLIVDGRIHPGRVEEFVDEAKRELVQDIRKAGEDALYELGISPASIDPKLISILGRLKFRTSYGQNALLHSMEVSRLSTMLGEELGADIHVCKLGGLLHDVGKAVDHDMQGSHPEIGYKMLQKFGFPEEICYQSIGHHEDKPKTLEAIIVKAADAISGARPGARKDSLEFYVKRLTDLENTAKSFPGVEKVYAIQAGRELRIFVNPKEVNDYQATKLARDIADKIASEMKFPGEIRVTLIREQRVIEYAK